MGYLFSSVCFIDCRKVKFIDISCQNRIDSVWKCGPFNCSFFQIDSVSCKLFISTSRPIQSLTDFWGIQHIFKSNKVSAKYILSILAIFVSPWCFTSDQNHLMERCPWWFHCHQESHKHWYDAEKIQLLLATL